MFDDRPGGQPLRGVPTHRDNLFNKRLTTVLDSIERNDLVHAAATKTAKIDRHVLVPQRPEVLVDPARHLGLRQAWDHPRRNLPAGGMPMVANGEFPGAHTGQKTMTGYRNQYW